jgi:predicted RNA methylase
VNLLYDGVYTKYMRISRYNVVVDVGANIGIFTLYATKRARMVIALEPEPRNYK